MTQNMPLDTTGIVSYIPLRPGPRRGVRDVADAVRERWLFGSASRTGPGSPGQADAGRTERFMLKGDDWPSLSRQGAARSPPCAGRVGRSLAALSPHYPHTCRPQPAGPTRPAPPSRRSTSRDPKRGAAEAAAASPLVIPGGAQRREGDPDFLSGTIPTLHPRPAPTARRG